MSDRSMTDGHAAFLPRTAARVALVLGLALPTACAQAEEVGQALFRGLADARNEVRSEAAQPGTEVYVGTSVSGKFLAGRHAEILRDVPRAADYMNEVLVAAPDNQDILRRTFLLQLSDGRIAGALALAERLAESRSDVPVANLLLAVQELKAGRMAAAQERLDGLDVSGPDALVVPMVRAWAMTGTGRGAEALALLRATDTLQPLGRLRDMHQGMLAEYAGFAAEADESYRAAVAQPENLALRTVRAYGAFLSRDARTDAAHDLFDQYISQNPNSILLEPWVERLNAGETLSAIVASPQQGAAEALYLVANVLERQRAGASALLYVRMALELHPDDPLYILLLARIYESQVRYEEAVEAFSTIDPATPHGWLARLSIASNLHALERVDDAAELLRVMANERPDRTDAATTLGDFLRQEEQYTEAVEAYDLAIERMGAANKTDWRLLYGRGIALERSKKWEQAEVDFLGALELMPDQPLVLNYLGYSWVDMGINLDRAKEMIERAVSLRPRDGYIVDSLGWVLFRLGDYGGAVLQLERAVELRPNDPIINDHLGDVYWLTDRSHEARFQWRRALGFDPEPEIAAKIEDKLAGREQPQPMPPPGQER